VSRLVVGIDPGKTGAIAVVGAAPGDAKVWPMPEDLPSVAALVRRICEEDRPALAVIEEPQTRPHEGSKSAQTSGVWFGVILGNLLGRVPVKRVPAAEWTADVLGHAIGPKVGRLHRGATPEERKAHERRKADRRKAQKARSLEEARQLHPHLDLHRKGDDGKADALHIAGWGLRGLGAREA
jgi:hypothetical protein